jgi:hypothetical protein
MCSNCRNVALAGKTRCASCLEQSRKTQQRRRQSNPDAVKTAYAKWRAANVAQERQRLRDWHSQNKEHESAYNEAYKPRRVAIQREYYPGNKERILAHQRSPVGRAINKAAGAKYREINAEKVRAKNERWRRNNLHKKAATQRKRMAVKLRAMPTWADVEKISEFYKEASRLTRATGIRHEVDHVIPLISPLVCGLHVHGNLRVIPKQENARKSNRFAVMDEAFAP